MCWLPLVYDSPLSHCLHAILYLKSRPTADDRKMGKWENTSIDDEIYEVLLINNIYRVNQNCKQSDMRA